jgi:glycosyltransferase involved in cell wall biosynthesis
MLPELVENGAAGLVVEDTPENLGQAIFQMATEAEKRRNLGEKARAHATREFRLDQQARVVESFYRKIISIKEEGKPS